MSAVKGSEQYQLEVVAYRPVYRWVIRIALLLLAVALIVSSYFVGHNLGMSGQEAAVSERNRLQLILAETELSLAEYRQQVANLELGLEVDRQSSEGVHAEVVDLKEKMAVLEKDINFYKGLMSPSGNKRGLTIGSLNVLATDAPRTFQYKLVLQQLATRHKLLTGYLKVNIVGRQNGQLVTLPLKNLNDQVALEKIKLRFKYFQTFSGEMTLPEGFSPIRIELLAKSTGKNSVTVEEKFGWLVKNPRIQSAPIQGALSDSNLSLYVES